MPQLSNLIIAANQLTSLTAEISGLTNLELLNFSENYVTKIPNISMLTKLSVLSASMNQIEYILFLYLFFPEKFLQKYFLFLN